MMTRLDRLARSTRDLLNILDTIAKAGAGFKSLADTWADTTTSGMPSWAVALKVSYLLAAGARQVLDLGLRTSAMS
jgi:DNA invertase Pin-like site-specific DNA recombinase